jgi:hypothetical protein
MSEEIVQQEECKALSECKSLFEINSREELLLISETIMNSALCPKWAAGNVNNIALVIARGREIGLNTFASIMGLYPLNGIISMYGDVLFGFCYAQPDREYITESFDPATNTFTCKAKRRGRAEVVRSFSFKDAEKAGLLGKKGPWMTFPYRMCQMRPRNFCLRDTWADRLMGIISYEDAIDHSNKVDFSYDENPSIYRKINEQLQFMIAFMRLGDDRINKLKSWANVQKIEDIPEKNAIMAISILREECPESEEKWKMSLIENTFNR